MSQLFDRLTSGFYYHLIRLCRIRSESERVARGFAIGIIPHFFPLFGLGAIVSAFLARVCGGNGMAGLISGAIFTPAWPFLFYLNLRVGSWILQSRTPVENVGEVTEQTAPALAWGQNFSTGAAVNSLLFALVAYLILLAIYERMRPQLLAQLRDGARRHRAQRAARRPREIAQADPLTRPASSSEPAFAGGQEERQIR